MLQRLPKSSSIIRAGKRRSVVQIWLATHEESSTITDKDYALADAIGPTGKQSLILNIVMAVEILSNPKLYTDGRFGGKPGSFGESGFSAARSGSGQGSVAVRMR